MTYDDVFRSLPHFLKWKESLFPSFAVRRFISKAWIESCKASWWQWQSWVCKLTSHQASSLLFLFLYTFPQSMAYPHSSRSQSLLKKKKENIGSLSLFFMIPWRKDDFINLNNETMLSIYCFIYCFTDILLQLPSFWSRIVWWASYPWGILSCHLCSMQYFTPGVLLGIPRKGVSPVLLIPNLFQTKKMSSFTLVFRPGL